LGVAYIFWTYHEKEVREFGETDNTLLNNTRISHKRQTDNNMDGQHSSADWIHIAMDKTLVYFEDVQSQLSGDSSFMVWPSLGTRMAEGKGKAFILC